MQVQQNAVYTTITQICRKQCNLILLLLSDGNKCLINVPDCLPNMGLH